jgi:hypothetical protein
MWELAGYKQEKTGLSSMISNSKDGDPNISKTAFVHATDARILYTDMVHVSANKYGVIINFLQGLGSNDQPMAVSRIGMSHEHANSLLEVLSQTIELSLKESKKAKRTPKTKPENNN